MLSPKEAAIFAKMVMICYGNKEFRENWERLRKRQIHGKKNMALFISDVRELVFDRLPEFDEDEENRRKLASVCWEAEETFL